MFGVRHRSPRAAGEERERHPGEEIGCPRPRTGVLLRTGDTVYWSLKHEGEAWTMVFKQDPNEPRAELERLIFDGEARSSASCLVRR